MKRYIKIFSIVTIIIMLLLAIFFITSFFREDLQVSNGELKEYVEEYFDEYRRLVEDNMAIVGSPNLTFYWNSPNEVEGIISQSHGAAITFSHREEDIFVISIKTINEPIEYYFWPDMAKTTENLPIVRVLKADEYYELDSKINIPYGLLYVDPGANLRYTGEGRSFNISQDGAVTIFGSLIEEDRMILKGSNNKEDWSKVQARFDALSEFTWDCRDILNQSTIEDIEARYKLSLLLTRINSRIESGRYQETPSLFDTDYEELKEIGAPNETLTKVLNDYYDMQKKSSPKLPEQIISSFWNNVVLVIIVGVATMLIGSFIIWYLRKPKLEILGEDQISVAGVVYHRIIVSNSGRTAAENCTGSIHLFGSDMNGNNVNISGGVCWANVGNSSNITINPKDKKTLDIYRIDRPQPNVHVYQLPTEGGWTSLRLEGTFPISVFTNPANLQIEISITSKNANVCKKTYSLRRQQNDVVMIAL